MAFVNRTFFLITGVFNTLKNSFLLSFRVYIYFVLFAVCYVLRNDDFRFVSRLPITTKHTEFDLILLLYPRCHRNALVHARITQCN